jgi:hypothetical protein
MTARNLVDSGARRASEVPGSTTGAAGSCWSGTAPAPAGRRLRSHGTRVTAIALLLLAAVTGCRQQPAYELVSTSSIASDSDLTPSEEVILTVFGAISRSQGGAPVRLDLATLERFGLARFTIADPWRGTEEAFSGVLMSTLLATLGGDEAAKVAIFVALDDYRVEIRIAELRRWPVLLATRSGGVPLAVADGGPSRIVYPIHSHPRSAAPERRANWVWNVETIEIR